jgi:hypothetical protein
MVQIAREVLRKADQKETKSIKVITRKYPNIWIESMSTHVEETVEKVDLY